MKIKKPSSSFAPHEVRRFILPITVASIWIVAGLMIENLLNSSSIDYSLLTYGGIVIFYALVNNILSSRSIDVRESYDWFNAISTGISLGSLTFFLPAHLS